ncbi:MAG: YoaK family protein [Thiohalocapsa sp.]
MATEADHPALTAGRVAVGIALTAVAGYVDCFGYLTLSRVYTAQMSGNTVLIAVHAGHGDAAAALIHAYTIAVFMAGLLVSGFGIELGLRLGLHRVLALALGIEAACLAIVALWGAPLLQAGGIGTADAPQWPLLALLALLAIAMGTQNTALRTAGILAIFTTHVTGTLTRLSEQLVTGLLPRPGTRPRAALREAGFSAGLWLAFFLGALLAGELLPQVGPGTVLLPAIGAILVVIAIDLARPFAAPNPAAD